LLAEAVLLECTHAVTEVITLPTQTLELLDIGITPAEVMLQMVVAVPELGLTTALVEQVFILTDLVELVTGTQAHTKTLITPLEAATCTPLGVTMDVTEVLEAEVLLVFTQEVLVVGQAAEAANGAATELVVVEVPLTTALLSQTLLAEETQTAMSLLHSYKGWEINLND